MWQKAEWRSTHSRLLGMGLWQNRTEACSDPGHDGKPIGAGLDCLFIFELPPLISEPGFWFADSRMQGGVNVCGSGVTTLLLWRALSSWSALKMKLGCRTVNSALSDVTGNLHQRPTGIMSRVWWTLNIYLDYLKFSMRTCNILEPSN